MAKVCHFGLVFKRKVPQERRLQSSLHGSTWRRLAQRSRILLRHTSMELLLVSPEWQCDSDMVRRASDGQRHSSGSQGQCVLVVSHPDPENPHAGKLLRLAALTVPGHGKSHILWPSVAREARIPPDHQGETQRGHLRAHVRPP